MPVGRATIDYGRGSTLFDSVRFAQAGVRFQAVATSGSATLRGINVDNCGARYITGQANSSRLVRPTKF